MQFEWCYFEWLCTISANQSKWRDGKEQNDCSPLATCYKWSLKCFFRHRLFLSQLQFHLILWRWMGRGGIRRWMLGIVNPAINAHKVSHVFGKDKHTWSSHEPLQTHTLHGHFRVLSLFSVVSSVCFIKEDWKTCGISCRASSAIRLNEEWRNTCTTRGKMCTMLVTSLTSHRVCNDVLLLVFFFYVHISSWSGLGLL